MVLHFLLPIGELLLRFILGDAVRFLDLAGEVIPLARNHVELVIGELAPLLLDIALELLPVAFDAVPFISVSFKLTENRNGAGTPSSVPARLAT